MQSIKENQVLALCASAFILCVLVLADLTTGPSGLPLETVFNAFIEGPDGADRASATILWLIRIPQTLTGILVGICLGYAGLMMQTILANPLASPYTLGFSAAAGFGASCAILFGAALPIASWVLIPSAAFSATLLACVIVYGVSRLKGATAEILVLTGIAVLFFFQSAQSLLQYMAAPEVLQQIVFWLFGSLLKASWTSVYVVLAVLIAVLPFSLKDVWNLTTMRLGDSNAESLGLDVLALRRRIFIQIAVLTAAAVSFTGTIGFIGLIAPHIARAMVGEDHRFSMPLAGLMGANILVCASVLSKLLSDGAIIPVGIITAVAGIPMLAAVIIRSRK